MVTAANGAGSVGRGIRLKAGTPGRPYSPSFWRLEGQVENGPPERRTLESEYRMGSQVTDAIYIGGVLKPLGDVSLHESERVRLIIERAEPVESDRQLAFDRLRAGIEQMNFFLSGPLPSRDELHDRF